MCSSKDPSGVAAALHFGGNSVRSVVFVWIFVFAAASLCLLAAARELCVEFSGLRLASLLRGV